MRNLLISLFKNVIRACLKRNEDPVELFNEALKKVNNDIQKKTQTIL